MRLLAAACLAATAAAVVRPMTAVMRVPTDCAARLRTVFAQQLQLPYPWEQFVDQSSGQPYYSNPQTGVAQWDPPTQHAQQSHGGHGQDQHSYAQQQGQVRWHLAGTNGVQPFSSGGILQKKSDQLPYGLKCGDERKLSRWNMINQKLTVSRVQAKVKVAPDGSATLTSVGKGPTMWRQADGPWFAIQNGVTTTLASGDQVSLDCNDPEAAIFTCVEASAMEQGGHQQGGLAQQGQPQLPYPWEQLVDQSSGQVYYHNPQTGAAQWEPPF